MDKNEIEIIEFQKEGYKPLVDYEAWRVAVLKYCDDLKLENIKTMQKHNETDEVFVLLHGSCTLFTAGSGNIPEKITAVKMLPHKLYNIKKGTWHNHIMNEKGEVLIVENKNTSDENSPIIKLDKNQLPALREAFNEKTSVSA